MTSGDLLALHDFISAIGFNDEALFRRRQALVAAAGIDEATIEARVGFLAVDRVSFVGGRLDIDTRGVDPEPATIIGVLDEDERMIDLCAWPLDRPREMATLLGRATMLGEAMALAHPATIFSPPLRVYRTALGWLKAGFDGCVPLDRLRTAAIFLEITGQIRAEDDEHGVELDAARQELVGRGAQIVVGVAA